MLRLSLALGRTPGELFEQLTATDLALYQALVEIDGPWWGEREAAHLRQIASVQAAAAGADVPPDQFEIEWRVGEDAPATTSEFNLLPAAEGILMFAAQNGLEVQENPL
ncbi:hypothetical protein [Gemmata massiliana]|uniref:hypothetical protein n=1 Tax=Gemmata massiliana TaxID=1210884 RepID=UPI0013A6DFA3|nr:hypothetical protein [Gemmata massiliana]